MTEERKLLERVVCEVGRTISPELRKDIDALLATEPEPVAWIQSNHLHNAKKAPFFCRVEPTKRDGFTPLYTTPPAQDTRRLALEEAARVCEAKTIPSYQAGGVAVESRNYAYKSCAAAIRALAAQHPEPALPKEDKQ